MSDTNYEVASQPTMLENMRGKINLINERTISTNKRLRDKLNYLRGSLPEAESNTKCDAAYGYLKETDQTLGFLGSHSQETENLLSELFELI